MRLATCVFSFDRGLTKMIIVFHETRPETRPNSPGPLLTTDPGVALLKASLVLVRVFTPPLGENRLYDFEFLPVKPLRKRKVKIVELIFPEQGRENTDQ